MIRTRIAPSPTGLLHVGNARTALFNWLFALKHGGKFIVRVEDTDIERSRPEFEQDALINFQWLGLEWDEGPILPCRQDWPPSVARASEARANPERMREGERTTTDEIGDYGPYRQSRRGDIYKKYLEELYEEGHLYHCFCMHEELEAMRQYQMARGEAPRYTGRCRELTSSEVEERLSRGISSALRFKMPARKIIVNDLVRGKVEFDTGLSGDTVIARDFTRPLFHLAVVVDDFTMEISHVIRGEDHLPNTPLHIIIQETLGFPTPEYAHIPLILGPDRAKLSKRHGATAVTDYRNEGYLPEAMMNFLALLGWHPETNEELFAKEELVERFTLQRVQRSAAIFNLEKLNWLNGQHLRKTNAEVLARKAFAFLSPRVAQQAERDMAYFGKALETVRERIKTLREIEELTRFYFEEPTFAKEMLRWQNMTDDQVARSLQYAQELLAETDRTNFKQERLKELLLDKAAEWGRGDKGKLLWPLRVALSGRKASPGPFEIAAVLGKEKTLKRIEKAISLMRQP